MGNPLGKQRRKRRKVSQRRKQPATSIVPSDTIEKIIHLHDVEHKGFRKVADILGMDKDRVHRIYKKTQQPLRNKNKKCLARTLSTWLSRKLQEIERKTKRAQAIEETRKKIRDYHMQRAQTSVGLEEIFSNPREMLDFAQHTVEQYKPFILFCSKHQLQPEQTLAELIGSKEDYLNTAEEEEGEVQDLSEYIGSSIDSFLMDRKGKEERERLERTLSGFMANFKCSNCGANIERFEIYFNQLLCKNCASFYDIPCPKCKTSLRVNKTDAYVTEYRCPSCECVFKIA